MKLESIKLATPVALTKSTLRTSTMFDFKRKVPGRSLVSVAEKPKARLPGSEQNRLKRAWISFWYRDITRIFLVLFPGHYLLTMPLMIWVGVTGENLRTFASFSYIGVICLAIADNDFSGNLARIGLSVYRRPLVTKTV